MRSFKFSLIITIITALLSSCTTLPAKPEIQSNTNRIYYQNQKIGIKIDLPKDWQIYTSYDRAPKNYREAFFGKASNSINQFLKIDIELQCQLLSPC
ncbi:MAG: hypothetical protein GY730_02610 [bacterium]|nr:hypothetical protein [bacterium]